MCGYFSLIHKFCKAFVGAIVCQPASLSATAPAPEPAGTFALWLQFPGMPNLRQLLRTCYLCQQCAGSAHHISCHSVSIWDWVLDWIHVCACLFVYGVLCPYLSSHICICTCICAHDCTAALMWGSMQGANLYMNICASLKLYAAYIWERMLLCVRLHLCELGLPCLHLEQR